MSTFFLSQLLHLFACAFSWHFFSILDSLDIFFVVLNIADLFLSVFAALFSVTGVDLFELCSSTYIRMCFFQFLYNYCAIMTRCCLLDLVAILFH